MGAESFTHEVQASTAARAFEDLVEQAEYECGHQPYNGTISTCQMGRCTERFDEPTQENIKKAYDFISDNDNGEKWTADYVELGMDKKSGKQVFIFYGWASC